jgi:hypothetical protein
VGAGLYREANEACDRSVHVAAACRPGADSIRYERLYPRYRALYAALEGEFDALAAVYTSTER